MEEEIAPDWLEMRTTPSRTIRPPDTAKRSAHGDRFSASGACIKGFQTLFLNKAR